jgi:hypothetical protein
MASSKPKTTMNKLNRERKVREKRLDKEARKIARQNMPADHHLRPHDLFQNQAYDPDAPELPAEATEADADAEPAETTQD